MPRNEDKHEDKLYGRTIELVDGQSSLGGYYSFPMPTNTDSYAVRGMTGNEENILISRDNRKNPIGAFFDLVAGCTQGLPMKNIKDKEIVDWSAIWQDDFSYLMFQIRRLTYGDFYTFTIDCPGCGKQYDWEEDLSEVETFYASKRDSSLFKAEKAYFSFTLPISGEKIKYQMPTAYHNHLVYQKRISDRDRIRTEALRLCVMEWDGIERHPAPSEWSGMPAFDIRALEQEMEKHRVGINTSIEPTCDTCGVVAAKLDLPIDVSDFLLTPKELKIRPDGRLTTLWASQEQPKESESNSSSSASNLKAQG